MDLPASSDIRCLPSACHAPAPGLIDEAARRLAPEDDGKMKALPSLAVVGRIPRGSAPNEYSKALGFVRSIPLVDCSAGKLSKLPSQTSWRRRHRQSNSPAVGRSLTSSSLIEVA